MTPNLFGTDGIRAVAGEYPLDHETVRRLGAALIRALPRGAEAPRVLVGRDTRESGTWIEAEFAHGAAGEGALVTSAGVVPTPAVAYLTRAAGYDAGVVISASHNPFEDNGIKVFSGRGEKFTERVEREVEDIVADRSWSARPDRSVAVPGAPISSARTSITFGPCFRGRRRWLGSRSPSIARTEPRSVVGPRLLSRPRLRDRSSSATVTKRAATSTCCAGPRIRRRLQQVVVERAVPDGRRVRRRRRPGNFRGRAGPDRER